jgi:hypothetical protein
MNSGLCIIPNEKAAWLPKQPFKIRKKPPATTHSGFHWFAVKLGNYFTFQKTQL